MTFDDRFDYNEQRFVTLVFLKEGAVSVVHTESRPAQIRLQREIFHAITDLVKSCVVAYTDSEARAWKAQLQ